MGTVERIELTTERLLLRPFREEDWEAVHEYAADPEVSRHQAWGPNTQEETRQFLQECVQENQKPERAAFHFAVVLKAGGRFLGGCTLRITDAGLREAMIGYTLDRRFWGRGYMTEAAGALLRFGFQDLRLHRVVSWCTPENVGSWRVMEKAGMRREGHEREAAFFKGRWHDWLRYAVLDREWRERRQSQPDAPNEPDRPL
jgi:RimJ/RimL family protein N-acetyltransferase